MTDPWIDFLMTLGGALVVAALVIVTITVLVRLTARRYPSAGALSHSARYAFRSLLLVIAIWVSVRSSLPG
ncbi:MAG: hypothetical protein ABW004_02305, partial [Aeromicrobium sp.]